MINYFRLVYTLLFSFRVICILGLRGGVNILLKMKVVEHKRIECNRIEIV